MSAIAGIYYLDRQLVERTTLGRMVDILAHRGSDAVGIWSEEFIGLGHRMLWTTPESLHEQLPLVTQNKNLVITADARIDNREELIAALNFSNRLSEKIADSQLILGAYQKWGDRCPEKLLGDFAFAIWDSYRQKLFCARDPMGVKPFYYYRSNRIFAFASEIKALLCLPEVPRELNELRVAYHLALLFEDQTITFYQDILRLPSAHSITVGSDKTQIQRYWSLDPTREIRLRSNQEYTEAFREIFTQAVQCRLRSAFPVGSTLSGGLDSSSITCTARNLLGSKTHLHTFSAIFPSLPKEDLRWIDERRYINAVKALEGFKSHDIHADCLNPLAEILWQDDEAIPAPNLYIHQALYHTAHQQGVRVFLDGLDGDSTISHGWGYLKELTFTGKWRTLLREYKQISRRYKLPRKQLLWKYSLKPLLIEPAVQLWRGLSRTQPTQINSLINSSFAQRIGLIEHTQALLKNRSHTTRTARQEHWLNLTSGLHSYGLELADKGAAGFSLEARYPFYDRRLIEFCLALPPEQKLNQGWTRIILRRAMTDILPPEVQWRVHKANLGANFKRKLIEYEHETLNNLYNQPQIIKPYVNLSTLQADYRQYSSQPMQSQQEVINVFATVTLNKWLQKFGLNI